MTAPRSKPDPRPMRVALGFGGLAVFSAIIAAIVVPDAAPAEPVRAAIQPEPSATTVQRPIRYVQLAPGESPPPGATVIDGAAPQPTTIVTTVPAPTRKPVIVRTTQSGTVIK